MLTNCMINFNCNNKLHTTIKVFTYISEEPNCYNAFNIEK